VILEGKDLMKLIHNAKKEANELLLDQASAMLALSLSSNLGG